MKAKKPKQEPVSRCAVHPWFQGDYPPRFSCTTCWLIYSQKAIK